MPDQPPARPVARQQTAAFLIVDDFLPADLAAAMRSDIDLHFATPSAHRPETHQVWNYWYVPGQYTYMRTMPKKIMRHEAVDRMLKRLGEWSLETLGLSKIGRPYLSFYVPGCRQGLHNDSKNGRFAFVYSLTRNERRTTGGETIVFREGDPFISNLRRANAGYGIYDAIEPRFNRLVVFDDRLVHGVERIEGSMDPVEGRFVIHGHIEETPPVVRGALPPQQLHPQLEATLERFLGEHAPQLARHHGPLVLRFTISPQGTITALRVLVDRVFADQEGGPGWDTLKSGLVALLVGTAFPPAAGSTEVTLPVLLGGALRPAPPQAGS